MIPFNLTASTRATPSIKRKAKTREFFQMKTLQKFTQSSLKDSISNQTSCFIWKVFSSTTALRYFKKKATVDYTPALLLEGDEEPMAREPIYLSSDESEYSTPNTPPDHHHKSIYPDSNNQLIASQ